MRVNSNIPALTAFNALTTNTNSLQKAMQQVSTGLRINSAADDAAGLAISDHIHAQSLGLERAMLNTQDGISLLQTAEGALGSTNSMLQRMRELAVQAANDTLTSQDRSYLQKEIDELRANIDKVASSTQFNTKSLLDGSLCGSWSSTDNAVKAYIRGAIETEGNYRIEVKANPGAAQVQKSSIFKVKHENVVTNLQLNTADGFGGMSVDGLPAGDYSVSTSMGAGSDKITYIYNPTLEGQVPEPGDNETVPADEYMTLTFRTEDGKSVPMPAFELQAGLDRKGTAKAIVDAINEHGSITINGNQITLEAALNEDGTYSVKASGKEHVTSLTGTADLKPLDRVASQNNYSQKIPWDRIEIEKDAVASGTIEFRKKSDNTILGNVAVNAPCTSSKIAEDIAAKLPDMGYDYSFLTTSGTKSYVWLDKAADIYMLGTGPDGWFTPSLGKADAYNVDESVSLNSTGVNSGTSETVTLQLGNKTIATVEIDNRTNASEIPEKLREALCGESGNTFTYKPDSGKSISLTFTDEGDGKFTIKSTGEHDVLTFDANIECTFTPTGIISVGTTTAAGRDDNPIPMTEADGLATLTGTYGVNADDAFSVKVEGASGKVRNNASILFTVTGAAYDQTSGMGTVTLSAVSNVLETDGTDKTYTDQKITISTNHRSVNLGSLPGEDDDHFSLELKNSFDISKFKMGDKFVYNICGVGDPAAISADTSLFIAGTQDKDWPYNWDKDNGGYVTRNNNKVQYNINAEAASNKDVHFRSFYLNSETGKVYDGDIKLEMNADFKDAAKKFTGNPETAAAFTANYVGKIAEGDTKLRDLEQFWNTDTGVFMLEQPQVITISQNDGKSASITLNASDTLNNLRDKLNHAISEGLGQVKYTSGDQSNNFVTFVETPAAGGMESVKGTMLIRSVVPGYNGELTFSSSYGALIDALGLNTIQAAEDTSYTASVYDAHSGTAIARNVKTSGNMLKGVIGRNIDVEFDAMSGVNAVWSESDKNFILAPEQESSTSYLHIVKNNISFQIGANTGEDITLDIGDMSSGGLGLQSVNVMTRERASDAIGILDAAIRQVSAQRTKIGSYQNELERTLEALTLSGSNLTNAESRIRDADISKSMMDLVKFQIIHQSGTSMLAQANQLPRSILNLMQ